MAPGEGDGRLPQNVRTAGRVAAGPAVDVAYRRRGGASGPLGQGADGRRPIGTGSGTQPEPRPPPLLGQQGPQAGHALAQEAETPGGRPRRAGTTRALPLPAGPLEVAEALLNPVPAGIEGCVRALGRRVRQQHSGVLMSRPVEHHQHTGQGVVVGRGHPAAHPPRALARTPGRGRAGRRLSLGPKGQGRVAAQAGVSAQSPDPVPEPGAV